MRTLYEVGKSDQPGGSKKMRLIGRKAGLAAAYSAGVLGGRRYTREVPSWKGGAIRETKRDKSKKKETVGLVG